MGRVFKEFLNSDRIFTCGTCKTHLSDRDDIVSKAFQGRTGRAFLFSKVANVSLGPVEERVLNTGLHKVADVYCNACQTYLGWKYELAFEETQKYKEGKFVLERANMCKDADWEHHKLRG